MAINATEILSALQGPAPHVGIQPYGRVADTLKEARALEGLPVEVQWDYGHGRGETRRVIAVSVENSGDPKRPTLRLICGPNYSDDLKDMSNFDSGPSDDSGTDNDVTGYEADGPSSYATDGSGDDLDDPTGLPVPTVYPRVTDGPGQDLPDDYVGTGYTDPTLYRNGRPV